MIQTVQNNKSNFTKRELLSAEKVKELYKAIRRLGYKSFLDILQRNLIHN